jgi:hypothetical protein
MLLYQAAKLKKGDTGNKIREFMILRLLAREALTFVQAGGRITLGEWAALDEYERAALAKAANDHRLTLSIQDGMATQGPDAVAGLMRPLDGGKAWRQRRVADAARRALQ